VILDNGSLIKNVIFQLFVILDNGSLIKNVIFQLFVILDNGSLIKNVIFQLLVILDNGSLIKNVIFQLFVILDNGSLIKKHNCNQKLWYLPTYLSLFQTQEISLLLYIWLYFVVYLVYLSSSGCSLFIVICMVVHHRVVLSQLI
jgi:ABC-type ATPase involved in cell division